MPASQHQSPKSDIEISQAAKKRPIVDIAREKLGPRGIPDGPDTAKMTPQREKKTPKTGKFDGHTA